MRKHRKENEDHKSIQKNKLKDYWVLKTTEKRHQLLHPAKLAQSRTIIQMPDLINESAINLTLELTNKAVQSAVFREQKDYN